MSSSTERAWERVRALKPTVLAHRDEAERLRRLPDAVAKAFIKADIYRLMAPADLGGAELDPITTFDMIEEVSTWDSSAGWNMVIGVNTAVMCGGLPVPRMRAHFSTPDCGMATSGHPGRAIPAPGGYRLTGHWSFASGIHQAKVVVGFAIIMEGDKPRLQPSGAPDARMFMLAPEKVTIIEDSWNTGGMRGTGSADFTVTDLFVPEADTAYVFTETSDHPAPIFRMPIAFFGLGLSATGLGVAQGAVDGLKALAARSPEAFRNKGYVQYAVAKASALHDSGQLLIRDAFRPLWENTVAGRPHTLDQKARARAAYVHGTDCSVAAVELCVEAAGGAGVYESQPFARAVRDVRAIQAHVMLHRRMLEVAGQAMLGVPIKDPFI